MKSLPEIRRHIEPVLRKIEDFRIEKLNSISKARRWYLLPVVVTGLGFATLQLNSQFLTVFTFFIAFILFFLVSLFKVSPHRAQFVATFKHDVFSSFFLQLYPGSYYAPDNYLPSNIFKASKLFSSFNKYKGEDYFEGTTDAGISFKFSELNVSDVHTDAKGDSQTRNVFKGLFLVLDTPIKATDPVIVLPDTAEKLLGTTGKLLQKTMGSFFNKGRELIYFEEFPDFEKKFVVYSKNKSLAKAILKPSLLKAFCEIESKWKKNIRLSWVDNYLHLALHTQHDFFNPNIKKSLLQDSVIKELYSELALCFSIVENLSDIFTDKLANELEEEDVSTKLYSRNMDNNNPFLL